MRITRHRAKRQDRAASRRWRVDSRIRPGASRVLLNDISAACRKLRQRDIAAVPTDRYHDRRGTTPARDTLPDDRALPANLPETC